MPTLRMLHGKITPAKDTFSSRRGGFECTGPEPNIPMEWLHDVLERSRFEFETKDNIWITEGLDFEAVANDEMSKEGYLVLNFINGSKVAIGFDKLETVKANLRFYMTSHYRCFHLTFPQ